MLCVAMCSSASKFLLRNVLLVAVVILAVKGEDGVPPEEASPSCALGNMLHSLLTPGEMRSLQVQALRRHLFSILQSVDIDVSQGEPDEEKRSVSALARMGALPYYKRGIEALARAGYLQTPPQNRDELDEFGKRSIATLAKNGQLPNYSLPEDTDDQEEEDEETKRSIEAMARNGYLNHKREQIGELLSALTEKRNVASLARGFNLPAGGKRNLGALARDYNFPSYGKRFLGSLARSGDLRTKKEDFNGSDDKRNIASIVRNGKRNIASLIRNNDLPFTGKRYNYYDEFKRNLGSIARGMNSARYAGKRNVAALLRQDSYKNGDQNTSPQALEEENEASKRNLASLKAHLKKRSLDESTRTVSRSKRQVDFSPDTDEFSVPVYQNNNVYDYEELMQALTGEYPNTEKRFLGRIPKMGRPKSTPPTRMGRR